MANHELTEYLIRGLIKKLGKKWFTSIRRVVICIPSNISEVEKRAVRDSAERAGAKKVFLIEEPMAAAIGQNIDVYQPVGHMVVDIGGGTTEIAIISSGGIVHSQSYKGGGEKLNEDIITYIRRNKKILIGEQTAEKVKCKIGSSSPLEKEEEIEIQGRDTGAGVPRSFIISSKDIREAMTESINATIASITKCLEKTPPELSADILKNGILLTGGGALLRYLDRIIHHVTKLPVHLDDNPLTSVARGSGIVLDNLEKYRDIVS